MEPFISIIMPAYNAENRIDTAISSIAAQTMPSWELLIVDDCSTDKTADIVNKWAQDDKRISLITLEQNSGPGYAKNLGMSKASGTYITFCDSDDWLDKDAFAILSNYGKETSDAIVAGYYRDICDMENKVLERNPVQAEAWECNQKNEIIKGIVALDKARLFSFAWNKLYRSEVIRKHKICFSDKKFGEDYDFNIDFFSHCESIKVLDQTFYHYIKQDKESLTEKFVENFYEINRERFEKMCALMVKAGCFDPQIRSIIMNLYIKHILAAVARLHDVRGNLKEVDKVRRVKSMIGDKMSKAAVHYAKATCKSEMICNAVFKTKFVPLILLFGRLLWFVQTRGKKLYEKIK